MKSFDAFLIGMLLVLLAATVRTSCCRTCPAARDADLQPLTHDSPVRAHFALPLTGD